MVVKRCSPWEGQHKIKLFLTGLKIMTYLSGPTSTILLPSLDSLENSKWILYFCQCLWFVNYAIFAVINFMWMVKRDFSGVIFLRLFWYSKKFIRKKILIEFTFNPVHLADATSTPTYSSDLHILGIIMQLSDLWGHYQLLDLNRKLHFLGLCWSWSNF